MKKSTATSVWNGPGKTGKGSFSGNSGALKDIPFSFRTRFEDEPGTNPEELIAAAHAGCFSMKLSFVLGSAGFEPDSINTTCTITMDNGIKNSHLVVKAKVPGIDEAKFKECVEDAKENCPVSQVLKAEITIESSLEN